MQMVQDEARGGKFFKKEVNSEQWGKSNFGSDRWIVNSTKISNEEKKMRKFRILSIAALILGLAAPAMAGVGTDLSGPHFNLNIIGVPRDKTVPSMTDSSRHVIFVPLNSGLDVERQVKIEYVRGDSFKVLDGNATDDNYAKIQVPYQFCGDYVTGCTDLVTFDVYAVGLGKPNGAAIVTAECTYSEDVVDEVGTPNLECEDTLLMGDFTITRTKGTPKPVDITNVFRATGCLDLGGVAGICDTGDLTFRNVWIFNIEQLTQYMWDYDNNGLKLMQVRFYETTSGSIGYVP